MIILTIISAICLIAACIFYRQSSVLYQRAEHITYEKEADFHSYLDKIKEYEMEITKLEQYRDSLAEQKIVLEENLDTQKQLIQETLNNASLSYITAIEKEYSLVESKFDNQKKELDIAYEWAENEKQQIQAEINKLRAFHDAARDALKREQEIQEQLEFYTLQTSDADKKEIAVIKELESRLRDPRPLNMLIWSTYYLKNSNALASRVLPKEKVCGIYKITNINTKQSYIGQAVDVKERWRDHMKCGLGVDTPAGNKLYKAMKQDGLESFTFELLEECPKAELNEKEKSFIELYDSYNSGYNSTKGNK